MRQSVVPRIFVAGLVLFNLFPASMPAQQAPTGLRIVIVEGDGAINNIRQRVNREPIVQVEDENRKPVAGAVVLFLLPDQGASGTFPNGAKMLTTVTDSQGQAHAKGIRPNNQSGPMQLRITASFQGLTASAVITQTNVAASGVAAASAGLSTTAKILIIVGIAAGGAAATGIIVTHNSGPAAVVLSPGTPSVGAP